MKIYLAADHAGFELKEALKEHLEEKGLEIEDMGAHSFNKDDDYPDFVIPAAKKVAEDPENNRAIVLGGSGQGEAIAANKVTGVYAAHYYGKEPEIVKLARQHNNSNVLALGARFLEVEDAIAAVDVWLKTEFDGERHERRIEKIKASE